MSRRTLSRILVGIVVAALLALAAWAAAAWWQLSAAQRAFDADDGPGVAAAGERFLAISPFEEHRGRFAVGTGLLMQDDLDGAEAELDAALETSPPADECAIRINLALVHERRGDAHRAADRIDAADASYDEALAVLGDAPEECRPEGGDSDESMSAQEERVQQSKDEMREPDEPDDGEGGDAEGEPDGDGESGGEPDGDGESDGQDPEPSAGPTDEATQAPGDPRREELRERGRDAQERQQSSQDSERGLGSNPHAKPW